MIMSPAGTLTLNPPPLLCRKRQPATAPAVGEEQLFKEAAKVPPVVKAIAAPVRPFTKRFAICKLPEPLVVEFVSQLNVVPGPK